MKALLLSAVLSTSAAAGIFDDVRAFTDLSKIYGIDVEQAQSFHSAANKARREIGEKTLSPEQEADLARYLRSINQLPDIKSKFKPKEPAYAEPARTSDSKPKPEPEPEDALEKFNREQAEIDAAAKKRFEALKRKIDAERMQEKVRSEKEAAIEELRARSAAELRDLTNAPASAPAKPSPPPK